MKKWAGSHYQCKQKAKDNNVQESKKELKRYLKYHSFYRRHMTRLDSKVNIDKVYDRYQTPQLLKKGMKNKKNKLQKLKKDTEKEAFKANDKPLDCFDRYTIKRACEVLNECHNTLMNSYVFAYYLEDNKTNKTIFEHIQGHLEDKIERLITILEWEVHKLNNYHFRQELNATVEFCDNHLKILVNYVKENKAKNTWKYINTKNF